jgi:hypothetical protein
MDSRNPCLTAISKLSQNFGALMLSLESILGLDPFLKRLCREIDCMPGAGAFEPRHRCGHAGQRKGVAHMLTQKLASLLRCDNERSRSDGTLSAGTTNLCAAGEDPYRHV